MPEITYDDSSYLIDGKRVFLVSGSVHYFRIPQPLWRDRLIKAKRAGLNCITTYVPWNFHEPAEGQWDFAGDRDVANFIHIARELGLYVILRPGPYICAEWDFGGLPGWLTAKSGLTVRTNNAAYMHYVDKYFGQLLPRLADQQITRGGNIVLIQNENEYLFGDHDAGREYLAFISQMIRRAGFDIPIITCNFFTGPKLKDSIENVNTWQGVVDWAKRAYYRQPSAPLMVTEYWDGWFDYWGAKTHETKDAGEVARRAMEALGCGTMVNYYMFHGGTNFDFWGARLVYGPEAFQTTSYDYDAPIAEGGGLTDKYYATRLVNLLGTHMGPMLGSCYMEDPGVTIYNGTCVQNLVGPQGRWATLVNHSPDPVESLAVSMPGGEVSLQVPLGPLGMAMIPFDVELTTESTLDYANLTPLGFFFQRVLVLHGPAGWAGKVSINGQEFDIRVPEGLEPAERKAEDITIAVINTPAAMRTWPMDDRLIIGPTFVGETEQDITPPPSGPGYVVVSNEGEIARKRAKIEDAPAPKLPKPRPWKLLTTCRVDHDPDGWTTMDRPRTLDQLGVHYGYGWYQLTFKASRTGKKHLFLPACADRATLFLNGKRIGVWGVGAKATHQPINVDVKAGENTLIALVDNLGRLCFSSRIGDAKGIFGGVYNAKAVKQGKITFTPEQKIAKRYVPNHVAHFSPVPTEGTVIVAEMEFSLKKLSPVHVRFTGIDHHLAMLCNDKMVGLYPNTPAGSYGEATLATELKAGTNTLKFAIWGEPGEDVLSSVEIHELGESLSDGGQWAHRPWVPPQESDEAGSGKDWPKWFESTFPAPESDAPLFVRIDGATKGQLLLNGRNVGRYWNVGPQEWYYLPSCWLEETNSLQLFSEDGKTPTSIELAIFPHGPYGPETLTLAT